MINDINPQGGAADGASHQKPPRSSASRPMADREVPLQGKRNIDVINAWLDGDLPEAAVRRADMAKDVELWTRINAESERRRQLRTPAHVQAQIMAAIPHTVPQLITPWYRREFVISPIVALAVAAGVVTLAVAATALIVAF